MFDLNKGVEKYKITEDSGDLNISYRWMACQAYFLIFFCLVWNGFLVTWYSIAFSTGELIMVLFPIIHVAVGVGLTYYTICLFINRTYIQVNRNEISIRFAPLPWLGAKKIDAQDITQFYVKEKKSSSKNGTNYTYQLWYKNSSGIDKKFAAGPAISSSEDAQFLEQKIENFLGIQDTPVQGEFQGNTKINMIDRLPRQQNNKINPIATTLENLSMGAVLTYDLKNWEVVYQAQYDWSSGQTDKMYRLIPETGGSMLLYLSREMGEIQPWIEDKLQGNQAAFSRLDPTTAPGELNFGNDIYLKQSYLIGKTFSSDNQQSVETKQWFYKTNIGKSLRILQYAGGSVAVFTGIRAQEYEFSNILPSGNR